MSNVELAKTYQPSEVEPLIAQRWNQARAFHAEPTDPGTPYAIMIPPPNVTAALHLGHALNNTLQDVLIRWRRMAGDNAMWMPGTDHAGIATQTVVEKRVLAEEGKRRTDFARDEFVARIQAWKDEYEARILGQLKAMGCSCDWDRTRFTMDPICARAVREAFFILFRDHLIYRGKRLVNWDPATQTALADDEVEMEEVDGFFYYLQYPLEDGSGSVTVATTRPETMLGDTAVAINPRDPRAASLRGKRVRLPIVNRVIPIIEDDYVVLPDPESADAKARFATGFLKVTPAHDPNDYEIGRRHNLPVVNVLAPDGSISESHGWEDVGEAQWLLGMDRYEAREAIVEWFRDHQLLQEVKPYRHTVGHSYRSHVAIEPYLSDQWYVRVTDNRLAGAALRALAADQRTLPAPPAEGPAKPWEGAIRFTPDRYARTFETWHHNIRDWCISRQLWWGHRIPVWSKPAEEASTFNPDAFPDRVAEQIIDNVRYVCVRNEADSEVLQLLHREGWGQDPDVLDTWFSSALWPISTLGWPDDTPELRTWNPSSCLSTAREIITLWVSRMVMFNLYFRDCVPFTDVFVHAMIQDGQGRKMSKSLGNGVDPLDIIDSHGSDAMRFTLALMTTQTQDVRMPVERDETSGRNTSPKFDIGRNFANKLWNALRFAFGHLESGDSSGQAEPGLADRWILARTAQTIAQCDACLKQYEFSSYAQGLYDFIWRDLCDWYIEAIKPTVRQSAAQRQVLAAVLDATLRLLHPVMPFITERLWEQLNIVAPDRGVPGLELKPSPLLVRAPWPTADASLAQASLIESFTTLQAIITGIREVRTTYKLPPRQPVQVSARAAEAIAAQLRDQQPLISTLANVSQFDVGPEVQKPADAAATVVGQVELYLHSLIEADAERTRLSKRLDEVLKSVQTLTGRLNNPSYTQKAPPHLVQQTRDQLTAAQREAQTLQEQLASL